MLRLILAIVLEIVALLAAAAVVIAAVIPMLVHAELLQPGAAMGRVVILGILAAALAIALFRAASAIKRHNARHK